MIGHEQGSALGGHVLDPELADDQNVVMEVADQVRETIQHGVWDGLRERRRAYL